MIKGIIFDLGGTLMYFDGNWEEADAQSTLAMVPFLNSHGVHVGDDFPQRFLATRRQCWKHADETGFECRTSEALGESLQQLGYSSTDGWLQKAVDIYFEYNAQYWFAFPDALEMLQSLEQRGLKIGLISNADDVNLVHRAVQRLGFAPLISYVISSAEDPRWRKPDPRIFHLVSDAWNLAPGEIVMVGDSPRYDVLGGHRAGMKAIFIDRGTNLWFQRISEELKDDPMIYADATVKELAEIPGVISNL
jgi:HAD superfamily hydrolase (TIGR01662 family)